MWRLAGPNRAHMAYTTGCDRAALAMQFYAAVRPIIEECACRLRRPVPRDHLR